MSDPPWNEGQTEYTITVQMRGHNANWSGDLVPLVVWASNLREALTSAVDRPLGDWFPREDDDGPGN